VARVILTPAAQEQLEALPLTVHGRVLQVLERLTKWPDVSGAKPMHAELAGHFRIRTGEYRVLFRVTGRGAATLITVVKVGKRDRFYE
jgi:mRNA interferase RelE/StbE